MRLSVIVVSLTLVMITGCQTAGQHRAAVQSEEGDRVSVGKVQREIRVGMSSADVIQALGSPSIVSTDDQRRESWIYDKFATDKVYSSSSGGISALILGLGGNVLGQLAPGVSNTAGASSTSQRTLTIIIKFDQNAMVRDFAYHTSKF
jgi:outer membrane protein assembly factor BamE (lipoprotein component of BamABCDE complex)